MSLTWKGVFPAVTTQMHADGSIDFEATSRHLEVLLDSGVTGIIMLGSLGENTALEAEEKRQVVKTAIETVNGRVPVLSGVSEYTTAMAVRYAQDMEKIGADGIMLLPAMVYKAFPEETIAHFRTVARNTSLPILCYNNPIGYHVDITPQMFEILAEEPNLQAIKESSGDTRRITDLRNQVGNRYALFTGLDDLILEGLALGADGWVAGTGLAFPYENQYLYDLCKAGEWEKAREIYRWYMPLLHLDTHIKFIQYIKLALQEVGLGKEWVRAPRLPLVGEERERILKVIHTGIENRPTIAK